MLDYTTVQIDLDDDGELVDVRVSITEDSITPHDNFDAYALSSIEDDLKNENRNTSKNLYLKWKALCHNNPDDPSSYWFDFHIALLRGLMEFYREKAS